VCIIYKSIHIVNCKDDKTVKVGPMIPVKNYTVAENGNSFASGSN
jgi:hypothetical protein